MVGVDFGDSVGLSVGRTEKLLLGGRGGNIVVTLVGQMLGITMRNGDGMLVRTLIGSVVYKIVGNIVGNVVGIVVVLLGGSVGIFEGRCEREFIGIIVVVDNRDTVGTSVGNSVGLTG